jgi:hypothetical protein
MMTPLRSGRTYLILMSLAISIAMSIAISCNVEIALSISCKKIDTKIGMKIDIVERALAISISIFDRIEQPLSISIAISILKIDKSNARLINNNNVYLNIISCWLMRSFYVLLSWHHYPCILFTYVKMK